MSGKALSGLQVHQKMYTKHHLQGGVGVGTAGNRMGTDRHLLGGLLLGSSQEFCVGCGPKVARYSFLFYLFQRS